MSYFDISIDNDITYLLTGIGKKVKVNNISAKAIINNTTQERNFDDKRIITHEELRRGMYIEYNNLWFLVLNEINDKRYDTYYKGIMRRCNEDIKFIEGNKLYLFPSIIQGDKFYIQESNIINISADTISVTIPDTEITRQLKIEDRFIKWGMAWKVEGIDYTKNGLIILHCKKDRLAEMNDDIQNEIANRFTEGVDGKKVDRLGGNINPIYPFDDDVEEPEEPEEPTEPEEPEEPTENITYSYTAQMSYPEDPDDEIWANESATYIIHKFIDGVEVDAEFEFTLEQNPDNLAFIKNQTTNSVTIEAFFGTIGEVILRAIDIETGKVAIEHKINIVN